MLYFYVTLHKLHFWKGQRDLAVLISDNDVMLKPTYVRYVMTNGQTGVGLVTITTLRVTD